MADALDPADLAFPIWPDTGVEPANLDRFTYEGGQQPVAEIDNFYLNRVSGGIHNNRELITDHVARHAAGGPDELNLRGLTVGSSATLTQPASNVVAVHPGADPDPDADTPVIEFDTDANEISDIRPINSLLEATSGVTVSGSPLDVTNQDIVADETTIWDGTEVPQPQLGGPAAQLTAYPLPNSDLAHSTINLTGSGGISVSQSAVGLGGSVDISFSGGGDLVDESDLRTNWHSNAEGGIVQAGDVAYLSVLELQPGEQVDIWQASLMANNLGPVPDGIDLVLGGGDPTDAAGEQDLQHLDTILAGDGATRYEDETGGGSPLVSFQHPSSASSPLAVFVGVDNGDAQLGIGGSGADREAQAGVICRAGPV